MQTHYERIGGESVLRALVQRFYAVMDTWPETYAIRQLHPQDLASSEEKLFEFLSGWMGGPPLFTDKYGPPMLRRRHLHFPVDSAARDQWMLCMRTALDDVVTDTGLREELYAALLKVADHMRNRADAPATQP